MDPDARKDLSKQLWKLLRRERRQRHGEEFVRLANQGAGLSKLKQHQSRQSGIGRINSIRNSDEVVCNGQESICEVFAKLYEDLYSEMCETQLHELTLPGTDLSVSTKDVETALKRLKNQRTGADDGLVAEMMKTDHQGLLEVLALFFTEILNNRLDLPEKSKVTKLKLIFKNGDLDMPKNYRPISIIPVMAKLFSTILYDRISVQVDRHLSEEQFGFRKLRGCADALHVVRMVIEKSAEWGE